MITLTKKYLVTVFIIALFCQSLFSQNLRDEVAIIRAEPIDQWKDAYDKMSQWLISQGEREFAEYVQGYKSGVHGSAFAVQLEGSDNLFVTNYHVIAASESISLEWETADGNSLIVEDCRVVHIDPLRDLALIQIEGDTPGKGFPLISDRNELEDGMEVWAAGYPGLVSAPAWQLSQGVVTNSVARIDELVKEGLPYLIQHSSVIDPGSSGGPLLIKNGPNDYSLVGINSLIALQRNGTFFAVPSDILSDFILEYQRGGNLPSEKSLKLTVASFILLLNDNSKESWEYIPYITPSLACEYGWDLYLDNRYDLSEEEQWGWDQEFLEGNTLSALLEFLAIDFDLEIGKGKYEFAVTEFDDARATVEITSADGQVYNLGWVFELGRWTMEDYPSSSFDKEPKKDDSAGAALSQMVLYMGMTDTQGSEGGEASGFGGYNFGFDFQFFSNNYLGQTFVLNWEQLYLSNVEGSTVVTNERGSFDMAYGLVLFPFGKGSGNESSIRPFANARAGISYIGSDLLNIEDIHNPFYFFWQAGGGLQFMFSSDSANQNEGIIVAVNYRSLSDFGEDNLNERLSYTVGLVIGMDDF